MACETRERELNEHLAYLQANAGSLILSGLSTILFPSSPKKEKKPAGIKPREGAAGAPSASLGMSDYLSVAKNLVPVFWEIAQPLITSWGIRKIRQWITNKIFHKKKAAPQH